jgi:hypothetical protein
MDHLDTRSRRVISFTPHSLYPSTLCGEKAVVLLTPVSRKV